MSKNYMSSFWNILIKKLDNGNRVLIPNSFLQQLGIDKNSQVLVTVDDTEDCITITKIEEPTITVKKSKFSSSYKYR